MEKLSLKYLFSEQYFISNIKTLQKCLSLAQLGQRLYF